VKLSDSEKRMYFNESIYDFMLSEAMVKAHIKLATKHTKAKNLIKRFLLEPSDSEKAKLHGELTELAIDAYGAIADED